MSETKDFNEEIIKQQQIKIDQDAEKIKQLTSKTEQLYEEYLDLTRITANVYKNAKDVLMDGLSPDDFEKLKNHLGV